MTVVLGLLLTAGTVGAVWAVRLWPAARPAPRHRRLVVAPAGLYLAEDWPVVRPGCITTCCHTDEGAPDA